MIRECRILLILPVVAISLITTPLAGQVLQATLQWADDPLRRLVEEGLANNKEVQALEKEIDSLKELVPFAGSLEDPKIGLAILNLPTDTFSFSQEPMTQKQIALSQKIPWFGTLDLKSKKAALKVVGRQADLRAKKLELSRKIATVYYELGFVIESLKVNQRLIEIVDQLLRVTETRYATGKGLQQDVIQAQVEFSNLSDEKIVLERRRKTIQDKINELLNRDRFQSIPPPDMPDYPGLTLDVERLQQLALTHNPRLQAHNAEIDAAEIDIKLARKDYWPDMDFKVAYGQREEDFNGRDLPDFISGSVMFNIPLWQNKRQDKKLAATQKAHEARQKRYRNIYQSIPFNVDALVVVIRDTQKNYKLFEDVLLIQARQWAQSAMVAYEVDKIEFNTMITAHVRLLRLELRADKYLFGIYQKLAELEELLGGPIEIFYGDPAGDMSR